MQNSHETNHRTNTLILAEKL